MIGSRFGRVGVLAGGPSNEREISLRSGRAVHKALIEEGIDAIFLDVREDIYDIIKNHKINAAFIALHGRFGEDGTVQKILEDMGIPYTGSGPQASKLALDKIASKDVFINKKIPVPRYVIFDKDRLNTGKNKALRFPVVVKPQLEGSSIGLSIINDDTSLDKALEKAFEYGRKALVEEYISGRELTIGILEDEPLPVIEIVTKNNVYDYTAKYSDPETRCLVPAPIEKKAFKRAQDLGEKAHSALGCRSFSRVDMMAGKNGDLFVLEVNTIPGMTERSLLPKAAQAAGLDFGTLCIKLIKDAYGATKKV